MPNSKNKHWFHAIWTTKHRLPLISPSHIEQEIYFYMKKEFEALGCQVSIINGMPDHVHCLFLNNPHKTVPEVLKQVKGSTSHHINQQEITEERFAWQSGFGSFSVSESQLDKVYQYIKNQKARHQSLSYAEEWQDFMRAHGLDEGEDEE